MYTQLTTGFKSNLLTGLLKPSFLLAVKIAAILTTLVSFEFMSANFYVADTLMMFAEVTLSIWAAIVSYKLVFRSIVWADRNWDDMQLAIARIVNGLAYLVYPAVKGRLAPSRVNYTVRLAS